MKAVAALAATLAGVVLVALLLLVMGQRRLIYPAPAVATVVAPPGFVRVALQTADGLTLTALYRRADPGRPTIIFFHGNGDSLAGSLVATARLAADGHGLLLPEYRGYGGNPGSPGEAGLTADADAAAAFLGSQGVADGAIFVIGNSLGSGPATALAGRRPLAGLVIVSGFTSLPDAVASAFRPLPPGILPVFDRFDNLGVLSRTAMPVLVLHGDTDRVIPVTQGRILGSARPGITYREFAGAGHDLAYRPQAQAAIDTWLASRNPDCGDGRPQRRCG